MRDDRQTGYTPQPVEGVTPVDQFLYSAHVELVARFQKTEDRRGSTEKG